MERRSKKESPLSVLRSVCAEYRKLLETTFATATIAPDIKEEALKRLAELSSVERSNFYQRWTIDTIECLLDDIFKEAMYGSENAIELLRDIGNAAAKFIEDLSQPYEVGEKPEIDEKAGVDPTSEAVRSVAARSMSWPVQCEAARDRREILVGEYLERIELGSELPFKVRPIRSRKFDHSSPTRFAWEICCRINEIRSRKASIRECDEMPWLRNFTSNDQELHVPMHEWELMAVSLPVLTKKSVSEWTDVAMAFFEWRYPAGLENGIWPEFVIERADSIHGDGPRGIRAGLRDKLREGIDALAFETIPEIRGDK